MNELCHINAACVRTTRRDLAVNLEANHTQLPELRLQPRSLVFQQLHHTATHTNGVK